MPSVQSDFEVSVPCVAGKARFMAMCPRDAKMPHVRYLRKNSMDSGSVKHGMMTRGTIGELIPSF